jgi:hypothetical protein
MINVLSWIDDQMKRAALLSIEEQSLSVWYYLSQLQPLVSEKKIEPDLSNDNEEFEEGGFSLDLSDYLDEDDFGLNGSDYLDEDDFELNGSDYLDEDDFGLNASNYVDEDDFSLDASAYLEEVDREINTNDDELEKVPTVNSYISVKRYVAASVEIIEVDLDGDGAVESKPLMMRTLIDFRGHTAHRAQFLATCFPSYWAQCFPPSFSFSDWLKEFNGDIYITHHSHFRILLNEEPISIENVSKLTRVKEGVLKMGIPFPALFYYTWRLGVLKKKESVGGKRLVYLVGDRLDREEYAELTQPDMKQVILLDSTQGSSFSQKERMGRIASVARVHTLSSLSFFELYTVLNLQDMTDAPQSIDLYGKRRIEIPVYLRMLLNNWAEKGEGIDTLIEVLNSVIHESCNEWWLEYAPEDVVVLKKILQVSQSVQDHVIPAVKSIYQNYESLLAHFKKQDYETKQAFFKLIEAVIAPIYETINTH